MSVSWDKSMLSLAFRAVSFMLGLILISILFNATLSRYNQSEIIKRLEKIEKAIVQDNHN